MPGAKLPITPIGNEPRWPGQRRSPISATGHAPDELFEEARQYFSEQELADLSGHRDQRLEPDQHRISGGAGNVSAATAEKESVDILLEFVAELKAGSLQFDFPDLPYQIVAAPAAVLLLLHQAEASLLVNMPGRWELALRP